MSRETGHARRSTVGSPLETALGALFLTLLGGATVRGPGGDALAADEKSGGTTWLYVGTCTNGKPSIAVFAIDQQTGSLKEGGEPVPVPMPVCIQWYPAPTIPSAAGQ